MASIGRQQGSGVLLLVLELEVQLGLLDQPGHDGGVAGEAGEHQGCPDRDWSSQGQRMTTCFSKAIKTRLKAPKAFLTFHCVFMA